MPTKQFLNLNIAFLLLLLVLIGCRKKTMQSEHIDDYNQLDSIDSVSLRNDSVDSSHTDDEESSGAMPQPTSDVKVVKSHYDEEDYENRDEERYTHEDRERAKRRAEFDRGFDAGFYGENKQGFDRDNYDPDLDDF